jgi:hypothetical protein
MRRARVGHADGGRGAYFIVKTPDALERAFLVQNRPGNSSEIVGKRNRRSPSPFADKVGPSRILGLSPRPC